MVNVIEIEKLQIEQGKKNKEMADFLGITHQSLLQKKKGRIRWTLEDAIAICEFLGITDPAIKDQIFLS